MRSEKLAFGIEKFYDEHQARSEGIPLTQDTQGFLQDLQNIQEDQKIFCKKQVGLLQNETALLMNVMISLPYQKCFLPDSKNALQSEKKQVTDFLQEKIDFLQEHIVDFIQNQKNIFNYDFSPPNSEISLYYLYSQREKAPSLQNQADALYELITVFMASQDDFFEHGKDLLWNPKIALQEQESQVAYFMQRMEIFTQYKNDFIYYQGKFLKKFGVYTDFLKEFSWCPISPQLREQAELLWEQLVLLCRQIDCIEDTNSFSNLQGSIVQCQKELTQGQEKISQDSDLQARKALIDWYQEFIRQVKESIDEAQKFIGPQPVDQNLKAIIDGYQEIIRQAKESIDEAQKFIGPQQVAQNLRTFKYEQNGSQERLSFFNNNSTQVQSNNTLNTPSARLHR